eukprot:TRINITY_DN2953_c1_g3_i2.p1 TRINITY_DN2953_c1_g3~~TRINITY_DN2953_c1_g3_i2.p1  ORF type:complete len:69 (-),score=8.84 TRINITY_DN2953_c1_g3_i2:265-471(-)
MAGLGLIRGDPPSLFSRRSIVVVGVGFRCSFSSFLASWCCVFAPLFLQTFLFAFLLLTFFLFTALTSM